MNYILFLIFGILPSLIWLALYLRSDAHPEPNRMIIKIFLLGMLATIPAIFIEFGVQSFFTAQLSELLDNALQPVLDLASIPFSPTVIVYTFLGVALIEELLKFGVVRWQVYKSAALDEPIDLPLYMIISALGFAALENILILMSLGPDSLPYQIRDVSYLRFLGATFLHVLASALFGYFLLRALLRKPRGDRFFFLGLGIATLLHGLFNLFILYIIEYDFPIYIGDRVWIIVVAILAASLWATLVTLRKIKQPIVSK